MAAINDTAPEAEEILLNVFRQMSMARKWMLMAKTYDDGRLLHAIGVRLRNPAATQRNILEDRLRTQLGLTSLPSLSEPAQDRPMQILHDLREVLRVFTTLGIPYALGGSMASSIHGIRRDTLDADITAEPFPGKETRSKGLSGGYAPLSAMICRQPIADAFWGPLSENPGFVEGHTFEGNPLSCAAGLAVLREILERDLCGNVRKQGERLRAGFERLAHKYGIIGDIRGKGLLQGIEFVRDPKTKEPFPRNVAFGLRVGRRALDNGLLCRFDPNWLAFGPPLVTTSEQIDEMVELLDQSIGEVLATLE